MLVDAAVVVVVVVDVVVVAVVAVVMSLICKFSLLSFSRLYLAGCICQPRQIGW